MKRENINRYILITMLTLFAFSNFAFGQEGETKKHFKIGLAVLKDNLDYQAARSAFVDVLDQQDNISFEYKLLDAYGDLGAYKVGLKRFVEEDKVDLVFATGTRSVQPAVEIIKDIPVIFTAVFDPVRGNLVKSLENPGGNLTGTLCGVPAEPQVKAILKVLPTTKTIGIVYTKDEPNAEFQTEDFIKAAEGLGIKVITTTVSLDTKTQSEVAEATKKLVGQVDVLIAHQDTSLSRYGKGMIEVAEENKIPTYVSLGQLLGEGAVFSLGVDFAKLGAISGGQALIILTQNVEPGNIPVETDKQYSLIINLTAAQKIGLEVPVQVLRSASKIIK